MRLSQSVRDATFANVLGWIIASVVLALIPQVRRLGKRGFLATWRLLDAERYVALPAWGWILFGVLLALMFMRCRRRVMRATEPLLAALPAKPFATPEPMGSDLSEEEEHIMRILADQDGRPLRPDHAAQVMQVSNLRLTSAIESLIDRGLIVPVHDDFEETVIALSRPGRAYLIERGLV